MAQKYTKYCLSIQKWVLALALTSLCCVLCCAQSPQPSFKNYTVADGLPSSEVYQVIQDKKGYMWFATDRGVVKYDGYKFKNFTTQDGLTDNVVFQLYEDYKERIWMLPMNGQLCYHLNDSIISYPYNDKIINGVTHYFQSLHVDQQDNLYIGTTGYGLLKISPKGNIQKIDSEVYGYNFIQVENQVLGSYNPYQKNITKVMIFNLNGQKLNSIGDYYRSIRSFGAFISEDLFCFNTSKSIFIYNLETKEVAQELAFDARITSFKCMDNLLFVGLELGGLKVFQRQGAKIVERHHFFPEYTFSTITKDRYGGYWFPTIQHGIFYIPNLEVFSYTEESGLFKNYIYELGNRNNQLTIGYGNRFHQYHLNEFSALEHIKSEFDTRLHSKEEGSIVKFGCDYYAGHHKLYNECEKFIYPNLKFSGSRVRIIYQDTLYLFNTKECFKYCNSKMTKTSFPKHIKRIEAAAIIGSDEYWLGTLSGLYRKTKTGLISMAEKDSLFSFRVIGLEQTKKSELIVATRGAGLIIMRGDKIINMNTSKGLVSNDITSLYLDAQQNIWLATNQGLNKLSGKNYTQLDYYGMADGLISNEITDVNRLGDTLYIATKRGLSLLNVKEFKQDKKQKTLFIKSILLDDKKIPITQEIDIYPTNNQLQLNYLAFSYKPKSKLQYKYRIKEISEKWHFTQNTYLRLEAFPLSGQYTIEILARELPLGKWSENPEMVKLIFHPPFYKTWWFNIILIAALIGLIMLMLKINLIAYNTHIQQEIANRILKKLGKQNYLLIEHDKMKVRINENDILFIKSFKDYLELRTADKKYLYRSTMKKMEERLGSINFLRVHRSFIVQKDKIDMISKEELLVKNHKIPIGKTYRPKLKELQNQFSRLNK